MDEYTQQLEMQLRFAEEEAQERERIAYESGKDDGYNQALEDAIEALGNDYWNIAKLEAIKR